MEVSGRGVTIIVTRLARLAIPRAAAVNPVSIILSSLSGDSARWRFDPEEREVSGRDVRFVLNREKGLSGGAGDTVDIKFR